MELFEITALRKQSLQIFADSYDDAVRTFTEFWATHHGAPFPDLEVKKRNRQWPGLDTALVADALSSGLTGVGRFDPEHGWEILPPDSESVELGE